MEKNRKKIRRTAAAALTPLLLLAGEAAFFYYYSVVRFPERRKEKTRRQLRREERKRAKKPRARFENTVQEGIRWFLGQEPELHTITSFDGLKLCAYYLPAEAPASGKRRRNILLLMHGYRAGGLTDFAGLYRFYHEQGYDLLVPFERSHGPSEGRYICFGVKERFDCRDWARYAARRFGEEEPLFLMGISMGCATVLMSLSLNLPPNVRGVLADCGFTSPWEIVRHVAKADFHLPAFPLLWLLDLWCRALAGFSLKEADTRKALGNSSLPVLFLHGKEDKFVPGLTELCDAVHAAGGKTKLHICGNTTNVLPLMLETGTDIIDLDWMVDLKRARALAEGKNVVYSGNYDPVAVLLQGTPDSVRASVHACRAAVPTNYISSAGCEVPRDTPPENLLAAADALKEEGAN